MRLATYAHAGRPRAALVASDDTLVPVDDLGAGAPSDMLAIVEGGEALWSRLRESAGRASGGTALDQAELLAPIPVPRRDVLCVGWNYSEHFAEGVGFRGGDQTTELPEYPAIFSKGPNTVVGPYADVLHSAPISDEVDWEVEMGIVIGARGKNIPEADAMRHIFGYLVANDVSVRDVQRRHGGQWFKGKNFDTHLPMGPWITTADEVADPHNLRISLTVDGATKQDSTTRFMVFKLPRIIKEMSAGMELVPGDLIITGTPEGVGFARKPPEFLKVGHVVEATVDTLGTLRNRIVAD